MYTLTPLCRIFRGYPAQKEGISLHATPATSASGIVRVIPDTDRLVVNFSLFLFSYWTAARLLAGNSGFGLITPYLSLALYSSTFLLNQRVCWQLPRVSAKSFILHDGWDKII